MKNNDSKFNQKPVPLIEAKFDHNMQPDMIEEIMVKGHKPAKIK